MSYKKFFRVPAPILRAATLCIAKKDPRYYLCGIQITNDRIAGTNGHILFTNSTEKWANNSAFSLELPEEGVIINIPSVIPARAEVAAFAVDSFEEGATGIVTYTKDGKEIGNSTFNIVGGRFPDVSRVIPTGSTQPTENIGFTASYLALIGKVFEAIVPKFPVISLSFFGEKSPVVAKLSHKLYGDSMMIVAQART